MKTKNIREIALETLFSIEKNQSYSNLLLNKMINKHQIIGKDIGLLTEIVYGTIQRRDTLDYYLTHFLKKKNKLELWVLILLRISVYQMVYLDRVPEHAVIYEAVEIAKRQGHKGISSMVNGVLRTIQREGVPETEKIKDPIKRLAIETSHPEWLVNRWVQQLGFDEAKKMCDINLTPPPQTARVNGTKITVEQLLENFTQKGIDATTGSLAPEAIKTNQGNLAHTDAYKQGLVTIQDESSMLVARSLGINEHDHILDSCAAPGGKSTHIAELLNNTGQVVCLDLHVHKVQLINEQIERLQLKNVITKVLDSRKVQDYYQLESFDKILVDAPCSGFGVIRRKPDIKYVKQEADIKNLASIQLAILQAVAPLLKKGGTLVYSTCTIDQEENSDVIQKFLENHSEFRVDESIRNRLPEKLQPFISKGQVQIYPQYFGTDGFYIASLRKQV